MDGLACAPRGDDPFLAQEREMLGQCRLRQADAGLQGPYRQFAIAQLTENEQAALIGKRAQESSGARGAVFKGKAVLFGEREHGIDISLETNLASANILASQIPDGAILMIDIKGFFDPATSTVTYLVADRATGMAAIVDPVLDYEPKAARTSTASIEVVLGDAKARHLTIAYVLETHAHADHLSAGDYVRRKTGAKIVIGAAITKVQSHFKTIFNARDVKDDGSAFDVLVGEGDTLKLGETTIRVLHTPGHTPACVTYVADDAAFVGDTVFMPDYGTARTDFPGGDAATLYCSIKKIFSLPADTRVLTGHDYPPPSRKEPAWEASVAEHRAKNIHIHDGVSEAEFVAMRTARDKTLAPPVLILPALQVNIRAGAVPPAEDDGHVYLKLPLNRLGKG